MTTPANVAFDASVFTTELGKVVDNFQKLVKSTSPAHPGALQDVYVDKMLVSVKAVLEASRALQRRAGISDVEKRGGEYIMHHTSCTHYRVSVK